MILCWPTSYLDAGLVLRKRRWEHQNQNQDHDGNASMQPPDFISIMADRSDELEEASVFVSGVVQKPFTTVEPYEFCTFHI